MNELSIKLHQIHASKTSCKRAKLNVMNDHIGIFIEEFVRLYDLAEDLKCTNPRTIVMLGHRRIQFLKKKIFYICIGILKSGWMEGYGEG